MERVVCAAIRSADGVIVCGPRHFDETMRATIELIGGNWKNGFVEQGFVNQFGGFLTREQAWGVAQNAGQIIRRVGGDRECLYSENLY